MSGSENSVTGSGNNVGPHDYKVNVIGRPNDWNGDPTSDGKTIFIGIKTVDAGASICEQATGVIDDTSPTFSSAVPLRERIYFVPGDFAILDRDATDGAATIQVPATTGNGGYNVYVRVLGGSNKNFHGCLDADAFVYATNQTLYYFAGHLDANRKSGVPDKVLVNNLFQVWYCFEFDLDGTCISSGQVSVFDSQFSEYFWNIQNDGLRLMQLIFVAA